MSVWKTIQSHIGVAVDGIPGKMTAAAIARNLKLPDSSWKSIQQFIGAVADGIPGKETAVALAGQLQLMAAIWPTQAEVRTGKSLFGLAGNEKNLATFIFPYQMFYNGQEIRSNSTRVHKLVLEPLRRIFDRTLGFYGARRIHELGLDRFDGCFNNRATVGGKSKSLHAWGIALDMDAGRNSYNVRSPQAAFSGKEYEMFWSFVESEGGVSLGRERNLDWMHFQFARLQ